MTPSLRFSLLVIVLAALAAGGCVDKDKYYTGKAQPVLESLTPLVERDVAQIRNGLADGAKLLAKHVDDDPTVDPAGLQRSISKARAGVHDLVVAKSTFFVFVGKDGTMLRSEADLDIAVGESLVQAIPETKKLLDPSSGLLEAWGYSKGLRGVNEGGDLQWVVGHPVVAADGALRGAFITGWSLRKYAEYLESDARLRVNKMAEDAHEVPPLLYVFVIKANTAYGGPQTPDIDAKAISDLALGDKVAQGFQGTVDVEGKHFAVVAKSCAPLGADAALAIMWTGL